MKGGFDGGFGYYVLGVWVRFLRSGWDGVRGIECLVYVWGGLEVIGFCFFSILGEGVKLGFI